MRHCHKVLNLLGDYISEDMNERTRRVVESHLATCARCAAEFRASRALLEKLPSDRGATAPADVKARVLAGAYEYRRAETMRGRGFARLARGLVYTAAVSAAVAVVLLVTLSSPTGRPPREQVTPSPNTDTAPPTLGNVVPPPVPATYDAPSTGPNVISSGRHPGSTNRNLPPRGDKKPKNKKDKAQTAPETEPEPEVVAPTPQGIDDATVVTPAQEPTAEETTPEETPAPTP